MNPSREKQWIHLTKISDSGPKIPNCEPAVCLGKACSFALSWMVSPWASPLGGGKDGGQYVFSFRFDPWLEEGPQGIEVLLIHRGSSEPLCYGVTGVRANRLIQSCVPRLIRSISRDLPLQDTCYVQQMIPSLMLAVTGGFHYDLTKCLSCLKQEGLLPCQWILIAQAGKREEFPLASAKGGC